MTVSYGASLYSVEESTKGKALKQARHLRRQFFLVIIGLLSVNTVII
jgi:hypothetical protein